jgi:ATP dependent DNA ligase-like protein
MSPALLVGERTGDQLRYCGTVEFGVGRKLIAALLGHVPARDSSPFANISRWYGATWLEPVVQAEITYAEVMQGRLRDPVLRRVE